MNSALSYYPDLTNAR